jgi:hypothetical protein
MFRNGGFAGLWMRWTATFHASDCIGRSPATSYQSLPPDFKGNDRPLRIPPKRSAVLVRFVRTVLVNSVKEPTDEGRQSSGFWFHFLHYHVAARH